MGQVSCAFKGVEPVTGISECPTSGARRKASAAAESPAPLRLAKMPQHLEDAFDILPIAEDHLKDPSLPGRPPDVVTF